MTGLNQQIINEIRTLYRDIRYVILTLAIPLIVYLLADTINRASFVVSIGSQWQIYVLVAMTSLGLISSAIGEVPTRLSLERSKGWNRMVRTTPFPRTYYLLAKLLSQLGMSFGTVIILFLVAGMGFHIVLLPIRWIELAIWLIIASIPFLAGGFLIGMLGSATQPVAILTLVGLAALGGLLQPINGLPVYLTHYLPTYLILDNGLRIVQGGSFNWSDAGLLLLYGLLAAIIAVRMDQHSKI